MVQGTPEYLFGSWNANTGPTLGSVLSDSAVTTTGTLTFKILSGNVPVVDSLITVVGTANASGYFNVVNASILTVSAASNPDTGIYTVTYAITSSSLSTTADAGQVYIAQPEVGDVVSAAVITGIGTVVASSAPVVSPVSGPNSVGKSLSVTVKLPANTTANPNTLSGVTVVLQGSNVDLDSEYNTVATVATTIAAGTTVDWQSGQGNQSTGTLAAGAVNLINFRFYRLQITAGTGAGYIVGKIMQ
jgi:hypothetical protein